MTDLTLCIFGWDEVATIGRVIDEARAAIDSLGVDAEIVVIDDGSTDGTAERADELARSDARIRVIRHGRNRGLGPVYRTGFAAARGRLVTFFPADGQFPPSIIAEFFPLAATHDMVLGYLPSRRPIVGTVLSLGERALYRALVAPLPRFQGVLMFRRTLLDELPLRSSGRGWGVVMELIIRAQRARCRIVSVPTVIRPREAGHSKVNNARTIWANLRQLLLLRAALADDS
jgi:glycosyltransferase involved in cell wall biosynthesis